MRLKRVVRVPAISLKMADIPPDDYSWRKYGQKPIKGSPHPRYLHQINPIKLQLSEFFPFTELVYYFCGWLFSINLFIYYFFFVMCVS